MAGLFFLLFFLSVTSLILFERIFVVIKKREQFELEIHFVFFVLIFRSGERKKYKKRRLAPSDIFAVLLRLCRISEVHINRLTLIGREQSSKSSLGLGRYDALYYATLAFIYNNSRSLSVNEDAFYPKDKDGEASLDVNIYSYFIDLLVAITPLLLSMIRTKRKERKYVREQNE